MPRTPIIEQSAVKAALRKLRKTKTGRTSTELGLPSYTMTALEKAGVVQRVGYRQTGKRGRPAVEWRPVEQAEAQS